MKASSSQADVLSVVLQGRHAKRVSEVSVEHLEALCAVLADPEASLTSS